MEDISPSSPFSGFVAGHAYLRIVYLLVVFSLIFLINAHAAPGADSENTPSSETNKSPQLETLAGIDFDITPVPKSKSDRFDPMITKAADRHQVDSALIKAVIMAESSYNPKAVSKQGAKGLMQLMPETALSLGVKDVFNPAHNINGGVKYLRKLLDAFNENIKLALAAYNAGSGTVKRHGGIPPIKATRHYVKMVFAYYQYYKAEMADQMEKV